MAVMSGCQAASSPVYRTCIIPPLTGASTLSSTSSPWSPQPHPPPPKQLAPVPRPPAPPCRQSTSPCCAPSPNRPATPSWTQSCRASRIDAAILVAWPSSPEHLSPAAPPSTARPCPPPPSPYQQESPRPRPRARQSTTQTQPQPPTRRASPQQHPPSSAAPGCAS
ncbi:hypothetical protein IWX90DRAFT_421685 [Phyllosticta citrichinensis]|uniref:Uncharacterized protein n=1 Tax=Phyllosticta citrichinensis TaxID=1130410 RepID=A0ABR1Y8C6_9PEZI